jgi:membrane protein implicated in regulation of membrane protease activity
VRRFLILPGIILFFILFSYLYDYQLGSIGFFLLSIYFFIQAKKAVDRRKMVLNEKEKQLLKEKTNKP